MVLCKIGFYLFSKALNKAKKKDKKTKQYKHFKERIKNILQQKIMSKNQVLISKEDLL